ncbi:hypothetical protein T12_11344 [Trichinella patagoniensis]|uniref:N-terminal Ras-GEF domain-containing protein n=1 Tax=Trichinella patagoniensis TaxID=990121 RepID=A0A0V1A5G4_9BILA|nr:hypothetical protein T12_11344 [Trichinella patagoniensis]
MESDAVFIMASNNSFCEFGCSSLNAIRCYNVKRSERLPSSSLKTLIKLFLHSTESPDLSYLYRFIQQYKV